MTNFNLLQNAVKQGKLVTFNYLTKKGELRTRLGFVHELHANRVIMCDVHKNAYRACNLPQIQGEVKFLQPQPENPYRWFVRLMTLFILAILFGCTAIESREWTYIYGDMSEYFESGKYKVTCIITPNEDVISITKNNVEITDSLLRQQIRREVSEIDNAVCDYL